MSKKVRKKCVLIFDFNIVYELLAGSSVLAHLKNDTKYEYQVVFNQECALEDKLRDLGFKTHRLPFASANKIKQLIDLIFLIPRLIYLNRKVRPDLLHANNILAARFAIIYKILFRTPLITHIRNSHLPPRTSWVCYLTDRFLTPSEFVLTTAIHNKFRDITDVVFDGIDSKANLLKDIGFDNGDLKVGMCSRLSFQKGVDTFCDLALHFDQIKGYQFYHAGGIPSVKSKDSYEKFIGEKYQNSVNWLGYIDDIYCFWQKIDIAIFPARDDEAFGRVVAEAMSSGIPVISTRCGGPEEIIIHEVNGFLVDIDDFGGFINFLENLKNNKKLRSSISKAARRRVVNDFSHGKYVERIHLSYEKVLG